MSGLWILLLVTTAVVCVWLLADEGVSHLSGGESLLDRVERERRE